MAQASRDDNNIPTLIAPLDSDGVTIVRVKCNPITHGLSVADGTTGTDFSGDTAIRDENFVPVLLAVSEVDGVTPVPVYVDVNGNLLVDSN